MKILFSTLKGSFIACFIGMTLTFVSAQDNDLSGFSSECVEKANSIKAGMTRADLEKNFHPDGGLSRPLKNERYVLNNCRDQNYKYMKLEIQFKPVDLDESIYNDPDRFLEWYKSKIFWIPGSESTHLALDKKDWPKGLDETTYNDPKRFSEWCQKNTWIRPDDKIIHVSKPYGELEFSD